ncbi:MAG: hypothetical protein R2825_26505 [Saprospiraceae bacterium]
MRKVLFLADNQVRKILQTSAGFKTLPTLCWGIPQLVFLFFFFPKINAQETLPANSLKNSYRLLFELKIDASHFTTDNLQNIYYTSRKNEVVKLRPDGTEQFRFINKTLGVPTYIDATNPFNLLLFYPDYQNVITLDRTMNLAGQFNLFELGLFGLDAVGMAGDGNLWLYDVVNFHLKKIGKEGQTIVQSADLSLELEKMIRPTILLERDQRVYLNDPGVGILVFDVFGKYLKTLPLLDVATLQVIDDELLFFQNGQLYSFHLRTMLQSQLLLPPGISKNDELRVGKDRLYVLKKGKLQVYGF